MLNFDNGTANVAWSQNDPTCNTVEVVSTTEKAVRLKTGNAVAWFPRAAFKADKYGTAFEVQSWFRAKMTSCQMRAIGYAA
jgi:hypothetical protein